MSDLEIRKLITSLRDDYNAKIEALKARVLKLESSNPECDCCQYELRYFDIGQHYEWLDEDGNSNFLTIPELYVELPDLCVGAKVIIFMYDYTLYLDRTEQDGWVIVKAVKVGL